MNNIACLLKTKKYKFKLIYIRILIYNIFDIFKINFNKLIFFNEIKFIYSSSLSSLSIMFVIIYINLVHKNIFYKVLKITQ